MTQSVITRAKRERFVKPPTLVGGERTSVRSKRRDHKVAFVAARSAVVESEGRNDMPASETPSIATSGSAKRSGAPYAQ